MTQFSQNLNKIANSSYIILLGALAGKFLGTINQVLLARILGPADYGLFSLALTIIEISTVFILMGAKSGVVRFISEYTRKKDQIGVTSTIIQVGILILSVSAIVVTIFDVVLKNIFLKYFSVSIIIILLIIIPFNSLSSFLNAIIQGHRITKYNVISNQFIKRIARICVFVGLFFFCSLKLTGALIALLVSLIITFSYLLYSINKNIISFKTVILSPKRNVLKDIVFYSLPLAFSAYILLLFNYIDVFSLTYFKTSYDLGIYKAAFGVSAFIGLIPHSFTYMFFPTAVSLFHNNKVNEAFAIYSSITKISFFISLVVVFFILLNGHLLINILYGDRFSDSYILLIFLGIGHFIVYATGPTGSMLNAADKTKLTMVCNIFGAVMNLLLNIPMILIFGTMGVAISTALSIVSRNILTVYFVKKYIGIFPYNIEYLKISMFPLFGFIIFFILDYHFNLNNYFILILSVTTGLLWIYFVYKRNFFNSEEIKLLSSFRNKIKLNSNSQKSRL